MQPVRSSLPLMWKVSRLMRLANSMGISPERSLSDKLKISKLTRLPNDAGDSSGQLVVTQFKYFKFGLSSPTSFGRYVAFESVVVDQ